MAALNPNPNPNLNLTRAAVAWGAGQARAFDEVMAALARAQHSFLLPSLHADVTVAEGRCAVYRRLLPSGSLKDLLHQATANIE